MNLKLEQLALQLPEFTLEASLELTAGVTGLFGPSGSGKTSLLELLAGLRRPSAGRIILDGTVLNDVAAGICLPPERRQTGYVPQDLALFPHLNAKANLCFGLRPQTVITPGKVIEILELAPLLERSIARLSGGEKQRIALGRALLASPRVLLLDEPLSSLDQRLKQRVLPYLLAIREEFRIPMLYVSHSREEIEMLCDEVLEISAGRCLKRD